MSSVLVAEDDRYLMSAYCMKLEMAGYDVVRATDGQEVLKLLAKENVDVILLDLVMPIKDGFAVLSEMQRSPKLRKIPVIVASNLGQKDDLDKAVGLGATDYLIKSNVSMDELIEKVKTALQKFAKK